MFRTIDQAARIIGCSSRTIRRQLAAATVPGAQLVQTRAGQSWRIPPEGVDALRRRYAVEAAPPVDVVAQVEATPAAPPVDASHTRAPDALETHQLARYDSAQAAGYAAGVEAVRAVLLASGATVDALRQQLDQQRDDALWWRCEALDARQQLDQARAQLAAAQVEAAQLRAIVGQHQRETVPIGQLRAQLRAIDGGAV